MTIIKVINICALLLFAGCTAQKAVIQNNYHSDQSYPENMYLSESIRNSVDSLYIYYDHALRSLEFEDTLGARIYFDRAFSIISNFNEDTKDILSDWSAYDSLLKNMSDYYEDLYAQGLFEPEAEEVREELTEIEEDAFGDSTITGSMEFPEEYATDNVPLQMNRRVELAIKYFQTRGRGVFTKWLERSGQYEKMIRAILREYQLPENLFYLAMIESGFNPRAYSYARASGLWQFIYSTGNHYGLRANWWFDERRDPLQSTHAAARHLRDLFDRFGDWYLALAGYNCSPNKIERRMRQYNTSDFWELRRLPRQTRNYVPTFIAANIIAENPEEYGFFVEKHEQILHDTVSINECVDLEIVANCVDTTFEAIKTLNPAVLRWCTPPGVDNFVLNLPLGTRENFINEYAKIPEDKKRAWVRHKVISGETLSQIAEKYKTSIDIIRSNNGIRGSMIRTGQYLVIPVPQNKAYYASRYYSPPISTAPIKAKKINYVPGHKKISYVVKKGDTIGEIAEDYNTRASKIRAWNGLRYGQYIYPNQKLAIWVPDENGEEMTVAAPDTKGGIYHIVKRGDTLWDIARTYNISIGEIKSMNNKSSNKIKPGERLKVRESSGS